MKTLPVRTFTAGLAKSWGVALPCDRLWQTSAPSFEDSVLLASPMRESTYATLFTYMYRRFGIPPLPGDDYKDLCGGWMLTTPSPSLVVLVRPSLSGPDFSFTPFYVHANTALRVRDIDDLQLTAEVVVELKTAYQSLLIDLLRPVGVRDSYMNALGDVDEDSSLMRCNKDGERVYEAKRHASAGFGVPAGLVGCEAWPALCTMIVKAGDGDAVTGSSAVVARLRAPVFLEASGESRPVKRLILLGMGGDGSQIGSKLGLSADDLKQLLDECALFYLSGSQAGDSHERAGRLNALLDETTDEAVVSACGLLSRLAYEGDRVAKVVHRALTDRALSESWAELTESGDGDFPFETLPDETGEAAAVRDSLRSNFEAGGHPRLVTWLDKTAARRGGPQALSWIVMHLRSQMAKAEADVSSLARRSRP